MAAAKPAIVGAFVLGGAVLGVAAILLFGGTSFLTPTTHAVVYFEGSVAGLDVGAPVTFRGVKVGSVTSIRVDLDLRDLTARIPVFLDLNPSRVTVAGIPSSGTTERFERLLKAGLRAELNLQSVITGQLRVELDIVPGSQKAASADAAVDPDRPEIPSVISRLQNVENEIAALPLKEIAESARRTLDATQRLADELAQRVGPMADSLMLTAENARATLKGLDQLVTVSKQQVAKNGDELTKMLMSSDHTVREAGTLVVSLREMIAPESEIRSDITAAARDLADSSSSLRGFTHEIERDPSALLSGRTAH